MKNKVDFSIEYSHIYTNETFSHEHKKSIEKLKEYLPGISHRTLEKLVFIDNYNSTEHLLDIDNFLRTLSSDGATPDFYAFEADMAAYKNDLISLITDNHVLSSYSRYINDKNKLPCSFMTAIWYLIRLGIFEPYEGLIKKYSDKEFGSAERVINILPERFRSVESQSVRLIGATKFSQLVNNIDFVFYNED